MLTFGHCFLTVFKMDTSELAVKAMVSVCPNANAATGKRNIKYFITEAIVLPITEEEKPQATNHSSL